MPTIFTPLNNATGNTNVIPSEVSTGLWSGDTGSLATIFTSSRQVATSGEFYYDLYNLNPNPGTAGVSDTAEVQFSIAYGHVSGGGSPSVFNLNTSTVPTQVTYAQYRNILLAPNESRFIFGETPSNDIYTINIQRSRLRQSIDPGNWQLSLSGSNGIRTFIDGSSLGTTLVGNLVVANKYTIRSGSIESGIFIADTTVYGYAFPDYGLLILHPAAISSSVGFSGSNSTTAGAYTTLTVPFTPYTGSTNAYQYQHEGLRRSISLAMGGGSQFIARSAERVVSQNYFIRLGNTEYNYSNNPTYFSGSSQFIREPFSVKPLTYITTIGLYNATNELLAVAKLSRPIQKSTDKEALIRVRLDY